MCSALQRYITNIFRKLGIHNSVTKHPYPCVVHQVEMPNRLDFASALKQGFKSKSAEWEWTPADNILLKKTMSDLMKKLDWIHTKDMFHWFSHSVFNGRISKANIRTKINAINHDDEVQLLD